MIERLQAIETRYQEITEEIMKPENISNVTHAQQDLQSHSGFRVNALSFIIACCGETAKENLEACNDFLHVLKNMQ